MLFVQLWIKVDPSLAQRILVARDQTTPTWVAYDAAGQELSRVSVFDPDTLDGHPPGFHALALAPKLRYACLISVEPKATDVHVVEPGVLRAWEIRERTGLGLAAGAMLAMASLALAFALRLRESMFIWYALYSLSFLGYLLHYFDSLRALLPRALQDMPFGTALGMTLTCFAALTGIRFAIQFNELAPRWPGIVKWIERFLVLALISTLLILICQQWARAWVATPTMAFNAAVGVSLLLVMYAALRDAFEGRYPARIYLFGWLPIVVLVLLAVIGGLGVNIRVPVLAMFAAAVFECLVLGFAIAERAWRFRIERDQARHDAERDALTGSLNRAALMRALEMAAGQRPATLLYCDLDHFKRINDERGHPFGDRCLRHFAQIAHDQLRGIDVFGRIGGEEFVAVLPDTTIDEGIRTAERLRAALATTPVDDVLLTVSIGAATSRPRETTDAWIERADRALYRAKREGRNRVVSDGALPGTGPV